jgi:hypothetical protein
MGRRLAVLLFSASLPFLLHAQANSPGPILAVLDFSSEGGVAVAETRVFTELLSAYIARTGEWRVIDPKQREAVLELIQLNADSPMEIGRLLSASQLVVGSVGQIGGWLILSARRVDVPTGQTLFSVSRKYPSLQALLDGAGPLARETVGAAAEAPAASATTARALIAASNRGELEQRLERLRRRVADARYARWLEEQGFSDYQREAPLEERLVFLEEYLDRTNTRGSAAELALAWLPPYRRSYDAPGGAVDETGQVVGVTAGWSYQFNSIFSSGAYVGVTWRQARLEGTGSVDSSPLGGYLGPLFIFGDKTEGWAVLLAPGFGYGAGTLLCPLRFGLYYRNFYLGYYGLWRFEERLLLHGVETGYSLFLGRRRSWPSKRPADVAAGGVR